MHANFLTQDLISIGMCVESDGNKNALAADDSPEWMNIVRVIYRHVALTVPNGTLWLATDLGRSICDGKEDN
jgi:hypothetical protein